MRPVVEQLEVLDLEIENVLDVRVENHLRERERLIAHLLFFIDVDLVLVDVRVAETVHELTRYHIDTLSDHHGQQRVGRDVETSAQQPIN